MSIEESFSCIRIIVMIVTIMKIMIIISCDGGIMTCD